MTSVPDRCCLVASNAVAAAGVVVVDCRRYEGLSSGD